MAEQNKYPELRPIEDGVLQQFYQEKTRTLAAGERYEDFTIFNYFRVLSLTGSGLEVIFGNNQFQTPFTGAGIGLKLDYVLPRLTLINTSGASLTLTYAVAVGGVSDDRLTVTGTLNTLITNGVAAPIPTRVASGSIATAQTVITAAAAAVSISAFDNTKTQVIIRNVGANDMVIGASGVNAATGLLLRPNESYSGNTGAAIFVFSTLGSTAAVFTERV